MKTALKILAAGLFLLAGCDAALALDTNLAQRIDAEVQTAGMQSLPDLTWLQGSTPAVEVRILRNGKATAVSTNVECRMLISSNLYTGTNYAQVTNTVLTTNSTASSMWLQWPTIGTNSCPSNSNTAAAWGYLCFFEDASTGTRYWNGSGNLYIEKTTSTGEDGIVWQEIAGTSEIDPIWTAASNRVLYVGDVAAVAYGTATNEAYRGDWGAAISNAAVLRSIATVPASDAYSAAASESLPYVVTNSRALTLSGLTAGSIGIRLTTTNASGIALYAAVVKDGDGEIVATINPACDGSEQSARWPWNASETLTVEATGIASPVEGAESAIVTAAQVETWADVSLVGRTNDLADQHLYVDYPAATNEVANRAYADDAADAALALALGEIATATFDRDLAGYVQRWNPRFDTVAASNSLYTLYGGSTALRLDGEGAAVVPVFRVFGGIAFGDGEAITDWPQGTILGATVNSPHTVATNDGILAFTVTADGSGFPLTEDGDLAGNSLTNGFFVGDGSGLTNLTGSITNISTGLTGNGSDDPLRINSTVVTNNQADVEFGKVGATLINVGDVIVDDDVLINGDLAVVGTSSNIQWTYVDIRTQVLGGTTTSYVDKTIYSTQVVFRTIITNIVETYYSTNIVSLVSTVGGNIDYGQAGSVVLPHLTDGAESNLVGSGTWVLTNATVQLAADATLGGVNIATGTPIYSTTYITDGFHVATPAIVTDGAAYLWAESNAWWTLDVTGANTLTAAVPWVISTNGLAVGEIPALAVKVALADSETNTWSWGKILTNSVTTPTAGSTNLFMLWWNGAAWVAY